MKVASEFVVPAAPDKVFALFFDPETMRICLPGCEELRQVDERNYEGRIVNEVAHVRFRAGFAAEIRSVTEPTSSGDPGVVTAVLKGEDRRLGSTMKLDATLRVTPSGEDALVSYEFEMAMWGKLGRLGESVIRRRSSEVEKQFATALAAVCAGEPVPQPEQRSRRPAAVSASTESPGASPSAEAAGASPSRQQPRDVRILVAAAVAVFACGVLVGRGLRARG